jgi:hypothetical protein
MNVPLTPIRFLRYAGEQFAGDVAIVCGGHPLFMARVTTRIEHLLHRWTSGLSTRSRPRHHRRPIAVVDGVCDLPVFPRALEHHDVLARVVNHSVTSRQLSERTARLCSALSDSWFLLATDCFVHQLPVAMGAINDDSQQATGS